MDSHLVHVPGLATLTARGLAGGHLQGLGGQADRTLDAEVLGLCALEEFGADLLERLDFARGEGDSDLVDFLQEHATSSVSTGARDIETLKMRCAALGQNVLAPRRNPSLAFGKTFSRLKLSMRMCENFV